MVPPWGGYHDERSSGSRMSSLREEMLRLRSMQQRLLLLRHALICPSQDGKCPANKVCAEAKKLWKHMPKCKDNECKLPHCMSSRYALSHYRRCKDRHCIACESVREIYRKSKAKAKHSTDKKAAVQYELQLHAAELRNIKAFLFPVLALFAFGSSSSPSGQDAKTPTKNSSDEVGRTHPKVHSENEQSSSVAEAKRGSDAEEKAKLKRAIMDAPFGMIEEIYQTRKRAKTTIDLTNDEKKDGAIKPDGSGAALRNQVEQQQQLLVAVKMEKEELQNEAAAATQAKEDVEATLEETKDDLEDANDNFGFQARATDIWQGRFDEIAALAREAGVDAKEIAAIRDRSMASGK